MSGHPTTINLTPSPDILEVIAEVDLQIHHCLAELVDNCLDELQQALAADSAFVPRVDVTLPSSTKVTRDSSIYVGDNGWGMNVEQLESALRAGSSGKQKLGSLGMFGMGFNIATARLGQLTEVRTGQAEDDEWLIASIDIRKMIDEGSYNVPIRREPKAKSEHGTLVRVTRLKDDIVTKLSSSRAAKDTKTRLGRIYTYLLRDPDGGHSGAALMGGENMNLYVNNTVVAPHLPCIWDPSRTVAYKGANTQAATPIDLPLADAFACLDCGKWYPVAHDLCTACGSGDIQVRERRIWGWVGVQRYNDGSDFGFSFFRQGRCLIDQDKELFNWQTPDGAWETEYPVEIGGGRLVGEIHLDFAKPQVRKTDFDRQSRDWYDMRERIRGLGPLRPNIAKARGYAENTSILGRYFNAFRRNDPGVKSLMPGNGKSATHELAREWTKYFRDGDPDYLTDEKWFEAAAGHDALKAAREAPSADGPPTGDDWLQREGLGDLADPVGRDLQTPYDSPLDPTVALRPETNDERFARYLERAVLLPETDREIRIEGVKTVLRVYVTNGVELRSTGEGARRQFVVRSVAGELEVYVDENCDLISAFGWNPMDMALMSAAPALIELYQSGLTVDELVAELLRQFPDRRVSAAAVRDRAESILERLRDRLAFIALKSPHEFWDALGSEARRTAENTAVAMASDIDWDACVTDGEFARYISVGGVIDLVVERPDLVLDGALFRATFVALGSNTQVDQLARLTGLLGDLRRMVAGPQSPRTLELQRFLLSADLLETELITE